MQPGASAQVSASTHDSLKSISASLAISSPPQLFWDFLYLSIPQLIEFLRVKELKEVEESSNPKSAFSYFGEIKNNDKTKQISNNFYMFF